MPKLERWIGTLAVVLALPLAAAAAQDHGDHEEPGLPAPFFWTTIFVRSTAISAEGSPDLRSRLATRAGDSEGSGSSEGSGFMVL